MKKKRDVLLMKGGLLPIAGVGTVIILHMVQHALTGRNYNVTSQLYPVYHVPGMSTCLLSLGKLLQQGYHMWVVMCVAWLEARSQARPCVVGQAKPRP